MLVARIDGSGATTGFAEGRAEVPLLRRGGEDDDEGRGDGGAEGRKTPITYARMLCSGSNNEWEKRIVEM